MKSTKIIYGGTSMTWHYAPLKFETYITESEETMAEHFRVMPPMILIWSQLVIILVMTSGFLSPSDHYPTLTKPWALKHNETFKRFMISPFISSKRRDAMCHTSILPLSPFWSTPTYATKAWKTMENGRTDEGPRAPKKAKKRNMTKDKSKIKC